MNSTLPAVFSTPYRMLQNLPKGSDGTEGGGGGAAGAADDAARRGAELVTADGRALPLVATHLRAECAGGLARYVLEQTFVNVHAETLRVVYKLPLPADGAVSGYAFQIGMRTVSGRVDPKEIARERFEQAIAEGKTAAILDQERADIFTQEIGNIPANETIVARITVDAPLAWLPEGEWEMRFPTVIGPRYMATPDVAVPIVGGPGAESGTGVRAQLELTIGDAILDGKKASSPSHALVARADGVLELPKDGAKLDRDIVVRWPVAEREVGVTMSYGRPRHEERHSHLAYGLLTIVPPTPDARNANVPRDLVVLLDTSGSMSGAPLEQAKKVVGLLIDALGPEDTIDLIEFSYQPRRWRKTPVSATKSEKQAALAWVRGRNADGGTEMYSGVVEALRSARAGTQRQVILVTDGYIGNEQQIVDLCHDRLPTGCRLHVVGVGSAVNRTLAMSLARAGRGAEILVGIDEDAERAAKRLLDRTALPVLTDVTITGDALVELAPEHVPDVFAGAPIRAAMSFRPEGGEIIVRGNLARGTWEKRVRIPEVRPGTGNQAVVALYAREHVADLEMRWTIGKEVEMIDRTIERVGVTFQIATRKTSWVAIDEQRSVDPNGRTRHEVMPHELPYGTSMGSFAAPYGELTTRSGGISPMALGQIMSMSSPQMYGAAGMGAPPGGPPPAASMQARPRSFELGDVDEDYAPMPSRMAAPEARPAPEMQPLAKRVAPRWPLFLFLFLFLFMLLGLAIWFFTRG